MYLANIMNLTRSDKCLSNLDNLNLMHLEPCHICEILLTAANVFRKHYKFDKIKQVFVKFE